MVDAHARKLAEDQVTIDIPAAKGRIKALKMVDQNLELLPGITEKVYSTFNYPEAPATFLKSRKYLKLVLYEIHVAFSGCAAAAQIVLMGDQFILMRRQDLAPLRLCRGGS